MLKRFAVPNFVTLLVLLIDTAVVTFAIGDALHLSRPIVRHFHENGLITRLSFLQLLVASVIAWITFYVRAGKFSFKTWRSPSTFWLIVAIGFAFLAIDEGFEIHEKLMQGAIFTAFNLKRNFLTVRINDLIMLLYGLVGVGLVWLYWPEIRRDRKMLRHMIIGFVLLFVMVLVDTLGNKREIPFLAPLFPTATNTNLRWTLKVIEETITLYSEALFIGAFWAALQSARSAKAFLHQRTVNPLPTPARSPHAPHAD
jgi:glucan phosphoethanolaminetransferase (alkaline phosphatase superfamily)